MNRREFVRGIVATTATGMLTKAEGNAGADRDSESYLDVWQAAADKVRPKDFLTYMKTGDTQGCIALEKLESSFDRILGEIPETKVDDVPAIWLVYNMGIVVKTREALFSVDLHHRRAPELAPKLDFALVSHDHADHYTREFYQAMNGGKKTVVSNFLDNYGAVKWLKDGGCGGNGGYIRGTKIFHLKDVEIRTSLADHNSYLVDYTTAFEIRVGNWRMLHSGDCSNVSKLNLLWGNLDLWVQMPGCGLDNVAGEQKLRPRLTAFTHINEMQHGPGRVTADFLRPRIANVRAAGGTVVVPRWGERIV